jgi:subtilase family serine protease
MQGFRRCAALFSVGLLATGLAVVGGAAAANAAESGATASSATINVPGSASASSFAPAAARAHAKGAVLASTSVSFDLDLALSNATGAQNIVRAVSDPSSASYHHYLTDAQWEATYGPSQKEVTTAENWLSAHGFSVGSVPSDRLFVPATGTAAQVDKAFGTTLGYYEVNGHEVRMANTPPTIPTAVSGVVSGLVGLNEYLATPDLTLEASNSTATTTSPPSGEPAPPAGYRNPQPCSSYWGKKTDTADSSSLYAPYTSPLPYDICGYTPSQLRSAYRLTASTAAGDNGTGVGLAIVDAYDSPTLLSDAQEYFMRNDPTNPLSSSQFFNDEPSSVDDQAECGGSGWYDEQSLDVEASHSMAPGADILFVGAQDCTDTGLLDALQTAVTSGASIVSDSWGDTLGDLLDDAATKTAYDDTFMMADATGVSVLFSSGDSGDNFASTGLAAPDYPPASPYITAVGGTALEVGQTGNRLNEYGWSSGTQLLCAGETTTNCGTATTPAGALGYDAGGGGGTSYYYTEPYYQDSVVPSALTLRNEAIFGPTPLRVEPDISMDADAQTGFLIGLTQTYGNSTKYGQFKEGGTSLASPLLAGVIADTDQKAGTSLGFLNPTLYKAYSSTPTAFKDIVPPTNPDSAAVARVNFANNISPSGGYNVFLRVLDYEGPEIYCDGTGNCATRDVTLTTAPGFDGMTGLGSVGSNFITDLSQY